MGKYYLLFYYRENFFGIFDQCYMFMYLFLQNLVLFVVFLCGKGSLGYEILLNIFFVQILYLCYLFVVCILLWYCFGILFFTMLFCKWIQGQFSVLLFLVYICDIVLGYCYCDRMLFFNNQQ